MTKAPSYRILLAVRGTRFAAAASALKSSAIQFEACSSPQIGSGFRAQTRHLEWLQLDEGTSWQSGQSMVREMPQCMIPTPEAT
jgi:hypothetical protein